MDYSEFSELLLRHPGVLRVEVLPDDFLDDIMDIENSFPHFGVSDVEPIGFKEICKKDLRMVMFCTDDFPMFTNRFMNFLDQSGSLIGHDILPSEKHQYKNPNYVWLTEHIFIDLSKIRDNYAKCVLSPIPLKVECVPDSIAPIVYYPCLKSADMMNTHFKVGRNVIATVLLGVDGVGPVSRDR